MESKLAVGTSPPKSTSPEMPFSWAANDLETTLKSKYVLAVVSKNSDDIYGRLLAWEANEAFAPIRRAS